MKNIIIVQLCVIPIWAWCRDGRLSNMRKYLSTLWYFRIIWLYLHFTCVLLDSVSKDKKHTLYPLQIFFLKPLIYSIQSAKVSSVIQPISERYMSQESEAARDCRFQWGRMALISLQLNKVERIQPSSYATGYKSTTRSHPVYILISSHYL